MVFNELKYEDPASFKNFTRINAETFEDLLKKVEPFIRKQDTILRESILARTRLLLTLRFLATGESFKTLHYSFRISMASTSVPVLETVKVIYNVLQAEYMSTPNTVQQWRRIADNFYNLWHFPNCLGALDGKHIAFRAKKEDGSFYYNYKGLHSIVLLAFVDAEYNFIFVDVGCNGRTSDEGVYANSIISKAVKQNSWNFPDADVLPNSSEKTPYVTIADEAFRLSESMMKPWGQRSAIPEKVFNYRLSRARRVVENAFGILANRFQILQQDINLSVDKVQDVTLTCCVLHNYIKSKEGKVYIVGIDHENTEEVIMSRGSWTDEVFLTKLEPFGINRTAKAPTDIRQTLTKYFNREGFVEWQWEAIKKFNF